MRASRLVSLLGLLQARGRMSTRQLAAELEVCERTVLRDIEALSTAGIPVYATRGRHGGFELMDGFSSDLVSGRRRGESPPGPLAAGDGVQRALIRLSPRGRRRAALLGRPAGLRIRRHPAPARAADPAAGPADWAEAWIRIDSPDTAVPDLIAPDLTAPDLTAPDLTAPDLTAPDLTAPDLTAPDLTAPDLTAPDLTAPDLTAPDLTAPDLTAPDLTAPDLTAPDLTALDLLALDLLALGAEVEVVRPPELRARMAQIARQIAARHAAGGGRDAQGAARAGAGN